jgi:hypothetical protein
MGSSAFYNQRIFILSIEKCFLWDFRTMPIVQALYSANSRSRAGFVGQKSSTIDQRCLVVTLMTVSAEWSPEHQLLNDTHLCWSPIQQLNYSQKKVREHPWFTQNFVNRCYIAKIMPSRMQKLHTSTKHTLALIVTVRCAACEALQVCVTERYKTLRNWKNFTIFYHRKFLTKWCFASETLKPNWLLTLSTGNSIKARAYVHQGKTTR